MPSSLSVNQILDVDTINSKKAVGPAFAAHNTGSQAVAGSTVTLCQFTAEAFDTGNRFNNTGGVVNSIPPYSFMPNVPGYYQFSVGVLYAPDAPNTGTLVLRKNGLDLHELARLQQAALFSGSALVYCNGVNDYVDLAAFTLAGAATIGQTAGGTRYMWFSGHFVGLI